jgi:CRP/FNR family cyclic AMP-dependent transcriptional regulator
MRTALYLFAALNEGDIGWLARAGAVQRFAPDAALIRRGEVLDALLILLDGSVRVATAGGAPAPVRRAGECLGEVSLIDTRPASTDVVAVEPVQALRVSGDALRRKLAIDPGFAARFWRGLAILLANRLRETAGDDVEAVTLDDTMLGAMARAGDGFLLLLEYLRSGSA